MQGHHSGLKCLPEQRHQRPLFPRSGPSALGVCSEVKGGRPERRLGVGAWPAVLHPPEAHTQASHPSPAFLLGWGRVQLEHRRRIAAERGSILGPPVPGPLCPLPSSCVEPPALLLAGSPLGSKEPQAGPWPQALPLLPHGGLSWSVEAALREYQRPGAYRQQHCISHGSGGWQSGIRVPA